MNTEIEKNVSGWTLGTYAAHNEALRHAEERFAAERDRRYTEVAQEREKALKIKEEADKAALGLAREIQTYKDEKANELREQISRERGEYVTQNQLKGVTDKFEATLKPVLDFVSSQQGQSSGRLSQQQFIFGLIGVIAALIVIGLFVFKR